MKLGIRCVHAACYYKGRTTRWSAGSRRDVESPSADNQTAGGVRAAVVNFNVFTFYIRIQPQQIMWNMFIVYDAAGTCGVFFLSAAQSRSSQQKQHLCSFVCQIDMERKPLHFSSNRHCTGQLFGSPQSITWTLVTSLKSQHSSVQLQPEQRSNQPV